MTMAMTLRPGADRDTALDSLSAESGTSKHALILTAIDELLERRGRAKRVATATRAVLTEDAELLQRLADA